MFNVTDSAFQFIAWVFFFTDFSAISKLMGIKWHQLSDKHKAKWQNMQRKQKILHKNIPTLSAQKLSSRRGSGSSGNNGTSVHL